MIIAQELDRWLTNEPSQLHYDRWLDKVLSYIKEEDISQNDWDNDWHNFIEPLLIKLSQSGTGNHGFVNPDFAASVVVRRHQILKRKRFEEDNRWYIV